MGCTDSSADNFDSGANVDDASCLYTGCMNQIADNYNAQANTGDQDALCLYTGCIDSVASNFNHTGIWYEYFSGDSMNVLDVASEIGLSPGEYQIWTDKKIQTDQNIGRVESPFLGIKIYPNPAIGDITISSNDGPLYSYEIMDSCLLYTSPSPRD